MGLFDRKTLPFEADLGVATLALPPHLEWEADYGKKKLPELAEGTRRLLTTIQQMKNQPLVDRPTLEAYQKTWMEFFAELSAHLEQAGVRKLLELGAVIGMTFEGLARNRERWPADDPLAGIQRESLVAAPGYLRGKNEAFCWPVLFGHLASAAERQLDWRQPHGQIDRRTWAALIGWSYLHVEVIQGVPASDMDDEGSLVERGVLAKHVVVNERCALWGYSKGRGAL